MSYVFPYGSNLCNNIQSWMRVGKQDHTPVSNGRDHPSRCDFHIHGTQILSFWHPLGHIDHGLRAWRASWVRPHTHTRIHTKHTHTCRVTASPKKMPSRSEWAWDKRLQWKKKKTRTQKLCPKLLFAQPWHSPTPAEPHWAGSFLIWHTVMTKQE